MSEGPAPGYQKKPDHVVAIRPFQGRVTVKLGGETIADSRNALLVEETGYGAVHYLPRGDVRMDLARPGDAKTYCPFKGAASYYSFGAGATEAANAAWSYEAPYDEAEAIASYLAFYPSRVDEIAVE